MSALAAAAVLVTAGPLADVSADSTPTVAVPAAVGPSPTDAQVSRAARPNRDTQRPTAADGSAAVAQRAAALAKQDTAISQAAKKAAKNALRKAAAAEKAKKAADKAKYAKLGYLPGTTDPREIARQMMRNTWGWGDDQYQCLDNIVIRESMWQIDATNPSSGAYGIPQSLPGTKMATVGADWRTNPATQITWILGYLKDRYGTPCGGWAFKSANGWY